jgi:multidrug resistance efflux pump
MKRVAIIIVVLVVLLSPLAAGWWFARNSPEAMVEFLVNGGLEAGRSEALVTWLRGDAEPEEEDALVASGSIQGETVSIVSELGGQIVALNAREGDTVAAGDVLVQLETSALEAQKAQVNAGVAAAQANLANILAGNHPAEILAAEAAVRQAIAQRLAAETYWKDMQRVLAGSQEIEAQIVEARAAVDLAATRVEQFQARLAAAELERDQFRSQGSLEEKKLFASLDYQVEAARAALDAAKAEKEAAQTTLAALKALRDNPLALVSQVHAAEGQHQLTDAGVAVAQSMLDELKAGPTPEEVAVAEAQVAQAEAAGAILDAQIEMMTLRTPMDGIVSSRSAHTGEAVLPGATLLTIANLDEVTLTIYVPEDELNRVFLSQEVAVQVDSFPGRVFSGTVSYISQQAEFTPRNVQTEKERVNMVFAVKVRLPNPGHLLKPGMPADASLK